MSKSTLQEAINIVSAAFGLSDKDHARLNGLGDICPAPGTKEFNDYVYPAALIRALLDGSATSLQQLIAAKQLYVAYLEKAVTGNWDTLPEVDQVKH